MKKRSGNNCTHGTDIFKNRPVCIFDIETKERIDFDSLSDCALFFKCTHPSGISNYIKTKSRKSFNGKKYAIRYKSSIKKP